MLESADGQTLYAYRSTQSYGAEQLDQVVTETVAVDTDQSFRFVVLHNDALGFCCSWYGDGYYRVYQGRGTGGTVLVSGTGDFDTYTKEELFSIGKPPPPVQAPGPTPAPPPPVPAPGTPFVSVVLDLDFGPEHLAWGIKRVWDDDDDAAYEYVDYRPTNTFRDIPQGTITEVIYLTPSSKDPYDFTMYNVDGGWVGSYQVYVGPVNTGRLVMEGDSAFTNRRVLERQRFEVLESDYVTNGWDVPSSSTTTGGEGTGNGQQGGGQGDGSTSSATRPSRSTFFLLASIICSAAIALRQ